MKQKYDEKIKCKKMRKKNLKKFEIFCENHPPTRYIKYKVINLASSNKSIMPNRLLSTNLERFLTRINSTLTR